MKHSATGLSLRTGDGGQRSLLDSTRMRRTKIVIERDAWIRAAPGRAFEVSANDLRSVWRIALTERGRVVATGEGENWENALAAALARCPRGPST